MSNVAVARPLQAPDLDVVAHDLFAVDLPKEHPATSIKASLGQPAGLLLGLLASNPQGLDAAALFATIGCSEAALERALASLHAFGRSHEGPVLMDEEDGHLVIAATHLDALLDDLDVWAAATGLAGVSRARLAQVDQERRRYRERARKEGKPKRRTTSSRKEANPTSTCSADAA